MSLLLLLVSWMKKKSVCDLYIRIWVVASHEKTKGREGGRREAGTTTNNEKDFMNTLITILLFSGILLTAVILAFLAGFHVAKLGVQEIIRDTLNKNKKDDGCGFDCTDSDYDDEEEEEEQQLYSSLQHPSYGTATLIPRQSSLHSNRHPYSRRNNIHSTNSNSNNNNNSMHRRIVEEHYTLSGDCPPPHNLFSTNTTTTTAPEQVKKKSSNLSVYAGDGDYLARI